MLLLCSTEKIKKVLIRSLGELINIERCKFDILFVNFLQLFFPPPRNKKGNLLHNTDFVYTSELL